ncbi:MAG: exopolysaccharide biosynthesis protein [Bdellovibrionota bacterium]
MKSQTESLFRKHLEELEALAKNGASDGLTLGEIMTLFGIQGHLILIIILCLPFLQPIPLVGLSSILGPLMVVIAFFYVFEKPPKLPKRFRDRVIKKEVLFKSVEVALKIFGFLEKFIHPRGNRFFKHPVFKALTFLLVLVNAFLLALPLPIPMSNTVPVLAILLHCLGLLEEDGILVILSFLAVGLCYFFFSIIAVQLKQSAPFIWEWLQSMGVTLT